MEYGKSVLEMCLAFAGGCVGASVSALGGFLLFGVCGVIGFLYLLITGQDAWLVSLAGGVLLKPSVCFLGGVAATAYARRKGLILCGKDIGRALVSFRRFDVIAVGGIGGVAGYLVNRFFDSVLGGKLDTVAVTVFSVSLCLKYAWGLTKTSDCAASSHAVQSPFRFFERLAQPAGKTELSILVGLLAGGLTWWLSMDQRTAQYAPLLAFCISAVVLYFLFMAVPVPATHHFSGPAGYAVVTWIAAHGGGPASGMEIAAVLMWGVAASNIGMLAGDAMGRVFFTEGDIHVDPPAMGIMLASVLIMGVLPLTGIFTLAAALQCGICAATIVTCGIVNLGPAGRV